MADFGEIALLHCHRNGITHLYNEYQKFPSLESPLVDIQ